MRADRFARSVELCPNMRMGSRHLGGDRQNLQSRDHVLDESLAPRPASAIDSPMDPVQKLADRNHAQRVIVIVGHQSKR